MSVTFVFYWASLVAQLVKNLPATRETWVQSLGWEDPLEKGKATHSSILAWGCKELDTTEQPSLLFLNAFLSVKSLCFNVQYWVGLISGCQKF